MNINESHIDWLYNITIEKLNERLHKDEITEADYNSELLKVKLWAEKSYREMETAVNTDEDGFNI